MSRLPLYKGAMPPEGYPRRDSHRGLWYDRFFDGFPSDWQPERDDQAKKDWSQAKIDWIGRAARTAAGDRDACASAAARLARLCTDIGGETRVYRVTWHFAIGLGNPHPVENGFLWHPTLGAPYIPGAAVKGLIRAWVEAWMFDEGYQADEKLQILYRWFGSEDKDERERNRLRSEGLFAPPSKGSVLDTEAGGFVFFDALSVAPVKLKADVMTPHMGKWYELGGEIESVEKQPECIPADWHDPVPIYFLVADCPVFQFAIAPRTKAAVSELDAVFDALDCALQWLGAGAKTAVGYGQMSKEENALTNGPGNRAAPTRWQSTRLQYNKGKQEISATGPQGERGFVQGERALTLRDTLVGAKAKRDLERGRLIADVQVEPAGGKNWWILAIERPQ